MRPSPTFGFLFLCLMSAIPATAQAAPEEQPALAADLQWLHLIDAGDYQSAWNSAAKLMQTSVTEPALANAIGDVRSPLGSVTSRTLKHAESKKQMQGAPDGHYVIAQYLTHFANKPEGTETIIASQAADGSWHVAGYFIR